MNERIVISEDLAVIYAPDGSVLLEVVEAVDEGDVAMIKLIRHEALGLALSILSMIPIWARVWAFARMPSYRTIRRVLLQFDLMALRPRTRSVAPGFQSHAADH
jgi:hypothetical protein